jgi:hypothetical protein
MPRPPSADADNPYLRVSNHHSLLALILMHELGPLFGISSAYLRSCLTADVFLQVCPTLSLAGFAIHCDCSIYFGSGAKGL